MADCNFTLPCESSVSSNNDALTITNSGEGTAITANTTGNFATALKASSTNGPSILGASRDSVGIIALSSNSDALRASCAGSGNSAVQAANSGSDGYGVSASINNSSGFTPQSAAVFGDSQASVGVVGASNTDDGVVGMSNTDVGVIGFSTGRGDIPNGVVGSSDFGTGVSGFHNGNNGIGVTGRSPNGTGVFGVCDNGTGVRGTSNGGIVSVGVNGIGRNGLINIGILGSSFSRESSVSVGIYGRASANGTAGLFDGDVSINGFLSKSGGGFKIDHPLDSANKYLSHSFVESSQMKNIYDGVVTLDDCGEALVQLPEWFETLNCDFCYQLTSIGDSNPNLYIAREISDNCFKIAGGKSRTKVSWQLTGIRQDSWAQAHPLIVEEEKSEDTRGYYLHPELYDRSPENSTFFKGNSELISTLEQDLSTTEVDLELIKQQNDYISEKASRIQQQDRSNN